MSIATLTSTRDALITDTPPSNDGTLLITSGYSAVNDGGGGAVYRWDANSTATEIEDLVIKPNSVTNGRWFMQYEDHYNARWFGMVPDGTTDNSARLQKAITAACAINGTVVIPPPPTINDYYRFVDGQIKINPTLPPDGTGAQISEYAAIKVIAEGSATQLRWVPKSEGTLYNNEPQSYTNPRPLFLLRNCKTCVFENIRVRVIGSAHYAVVWDMGCFNGPETYTGGTKQVFGSSSWNRWVNCRITHGGLVTDTIGWRLFSLPATDNGADLSYNTWTDCSIEGATGTNSVEDLRRTMACRNIGWMVSGANSKEMLLRNCSTTMLSVALTTFAPTVNQAAYGGTGAATDGTECKTESFGGTSNGIAYLLRPGVYTLGQGRWEKGAMWMLVAPKSVQIPTSLTCTGINFLTGFMPWDNGPSNLNDENSGLFGGQPKTGTLASWTYNATSGTATATLESDTITGIIGSGCEVQFASATRFKVGDFVTFGRLGSSTGAFITTTLSANTTANGTTFQVPTAAALQPGDMVYIGETGPYPIGTMASQGGGIDTWNITATLPTQNGALPPYVISQNAKVRVLHETRRVASIGTGGSIVFPNQPLQSNPIGLPAACDQVWKVGDLMTVSGVDFFVTAVNYGTHAISLEDIRAQATRVAAPVSASAGDQVTQSKARMFPFNSNWSSGSNAGPRAGTVVQLNSPGQYKLNFKLDCLNWTGGTRQSASYATLAANPTGTTSKSNSNLEVSGEVSIGYDDFTTRGRVGNWAVFDRGQWRYDLTGVQISGLATAGLGHVSSAARDFDGLMIGDSLGDTTFNDAAYNPDSLAGKREPQSGSPWWLRIPMLNAGSTASLDCSTGGSLGIDAASLSVETLTLTGSPTAAFSLYYPQLKNWNGHSIHNTTGQTVTLKVHDSKGNTAFTTAQILNGQTKAITVTNTGIVAS